MARKLEATDGQTDEANAMIALAEDLKVEYGISEEEIDADGFGLFNHVTGRSLTNPRR